MKVLGMQGFSLARHVGSAIIAHYSIGSKNMRCTRFAAAIVAVFSAGTTAVAQPVIYASDSLSRIWRVPPGGIGTTVYANGVTPSGLAFDGVGNLFFAEDGGTVRFVPPGGGTPQPFASGFSAPQGIEWGPDGNLYVANFFNDTISRVGPAGGTPTLFATGIIDPAGIGFGPDGNLYITNSGGTTISRVGPGGGVASVFATGFNFPLDIAFDLSGNLYATNLANNTVSRVGPAGGVASVFATGFNAPYGLEFDILGSGDLYVANQSGTISRVGPAGGAATLYATGVTTATFLAMQVPEPSALILCAVGCGGFALRRWRRDRRRESI